MKIRINGIRIGYDILGADGYPIVLIHGLGLDRTIWFEMASRYLQDYRVILPDVRGHGESDAPEGTYTMSLLADDLAEFLEVLGIGKAVICGHSMGGYITLAFAARHPEMMSGMGLITSRADADSEEKRKGRYQMVEAIRMRGSIALAESLAPRLAKEASIVQRAYDLIVQNKPQGLIGTLKGLAERPDRTYLLPNIQVPALVAAGEEDQIIHTDYSRKMASALPDGRFIILPGIGHMPMLERPGTLSEGVLDLLIRIETDAGRS